MTTDTTTTQVYRVYIRTTPEAVWDATQDLWRLLNPAAAAESPFDKSQR